MSANRIERAFKALALVEEIADMTKDGEINDEGGEYIMENDDAYHTVMSLISAAREVCGLPINREEGS